MKERFSVHLTIGLLIINEKNEILMMKRCNTGYMDGMYGFISGHVEEGESLKQAIARETLEEAGIKIKEEDLEIVHVMHRKAKDRESIDYFLTCKSYAGKISIMEKDKCDELKFYYLDKLPINVIPYVRKGIEYYQNNIPFSIYGW